MAHNEDTRVKIPALVHFTRLGYEYISLKQNKDDFDLETNIYIPAFRVALEKINQISLNLEETKRIIRGLRANLDSELGRAFYQNLIKGYEGKKLIDFSCDDKNIYQVITELPCINNNDEFRPDITILVNGIPLAFVEVKKPNNKNGIQAEYERMLYRASNQNFRHFLNMFQIMVFSNNLPYDDEESIPFQGAFYATTAESKIFLNRFREEKTQELLQSLTPIDPEVEKSILRDTNHSTLREDLEYQTNMRATTPTNSIISSLFYKERLKMLLKYGIVYVEKTLDTGIKKQEKHIMRYPQLFATQAIKAKLDLGIKKGIIWHTQGSGKTALAYYNTRFLKDYFQNKGLIAQFYFIVDRLDLANQSADEFRSRGLRVELIESRDKFEEHIGNSGVSHNSGEDSIVVVNIHKFSDKSIAKTPNYNLGIQRVYFIDEAHRSYNPSGSFLSNLFNSDKDSIKIALTGTPLIGVVYDDKGNRVDGKQYDSKQIFGDYIHKYYYNQSISDHYTLRLIREEVLTTYKEALRDTLKDLEVLKGEIDKRELFAHPSYVKKLVEYITKDFKDNRSKNIGGMIVCNSSSQAKAVFEEMKSSEFSSALILSHSDTGTAEEKKQWQNAFKKGEIDFLIVYNMLLTGFDAPRLKRLYLGRVIKDHSLLQTLTRVNRPYQDFRYGYVIDFADISKEFDKTNQAYFKELQNELGDAFQEYNSIFKTPEEIQTNLDEIKNILFGFDVKNAEQFSIQISEIKDKKELLALAKALQLYKELYNIAKLHHYQDLAHLFDLEKIHSLYTEVSLRIQLLNSKEILQNASNIEEILSIAIEDLKFEFKKIKEHELPIADKFRDSLIKVQKEMIKSQDINDPQYTTLKEELQRILSKNNIEELTSEEAQKYTEELMKIYEQIHALNQQNSRIANQYEGDYKFMRVHKKIIEEFSITDKVKLNGFLLEIKHQVDDRLLNNEGEMSNERLFEGRIKDIIRDNNLLNLEAIQRREIASLVANEYQNERIFA